MVRCEDTPAPIHHLVLGKTSPEIPPVLLELPWVKAVVSHDGGSRTGKWKDHFHYHCFLQFDRNYTKVNIKNLLKKYPAFSTHSGNPDWSFRPHDNYIHWCNYVCQNRTAKLVKYDEELNNIYVPAMLAPKPAVIEHIEGLQEVVKTASVRKSRSERLKLKEHLIEIWKWEENAQFDLPDYKAATALCKARIVQWYSGWLDDRDGIRMLRFLMYTFGTDKLRDELSDKISHTWDKYV